MATFHKHPAPVHEPSGIRAWPVRLRAYLELVRPPNVTTALADVLAGSAVAGLGQPRPVLWLLAATACLYAGGVTLNDFFDRKLDAVERPERPIPSGRVPPARAAVIGVAFLTGGIAAASQANQPAGMVAVAIAVLVTLYDAWSKPLPVIGPINMGACRGLNLLLGIAVTPAALPTRWAWALLPFTYICAVTLVSRGEVHGGKRPVAALAVAAVAGVLAALLLMALRSGPHVFLSAGLTAVLGWRVLPAFWRACQDDRPAVARHAVKTGVLSLVVLDAAVAGIYTGVLYVALILAVAVVAGILARLFAVT